MDLTFLLLLLSTFIIFVLIIFINTTVKKNQLTKIFKFNLLFMFIWDLALTFQIIFSEKLNIPIIYFDYVAYVGICLLPVSVLFTGLIFAKTKITFRKSYLLLLIIPLLSLGMLWTNDYHHLFYNVYSLNLNAVKFGPFLILHNIYTYILLFIGLFYLIRFSIKNSGLFSKQSLLIVLGIAVPLVVNLIGTLQIFPMPIYWTPIAFTVTILCCALAIFKFQFLGAAPIALQKIVDRISDSYIVLNEENCISDFNQTFLTTFNVKDADIRGKDLEQFFKTKKYNFNLKKIKSSLEKAKNSTKTYSFEQEIKEINKIFSIEINTISSKGTFLGILILLKDITQHIQDMQQIKDKQETLMEKERLASLGQLIGGIAHNLKTPIMSISGAAEGLTDLVKEYDSSIDDPEVNSQDHHDIAKDMTVWISKIREYTEYMSDVITAVKGQAVTLSNEENVSFTVDELLKRVNILMKHELKNAITYLNINMNDNQNITIDGDVNSLVQVINNMISNSIQAYNGKPEQNIDINVKREKNNLIISVQDYACGIPQKVKDKLFKEMITTKGKNGTGLGLYMSYSTIRANFNGNMTVESEEGKGTTFDIILPIKK